MKRSLGLEEEEPPIMLKNIHLTNTSPSHEPFFLKLAINDLLLHNCMSYFGAFANIIPLKVLKQLNLNITCKYNNVCRFDSRFVNVEGLIKFLKVSLAMNKDISFLMDVVVINIPNPIL